MQDAVRSHLARVVVQDADPRAHTRANNERLDVEVLATDLLERANHRRHGARHDGSPDVLRGQIDRTQQADDEHRELVREVVLVSCDTEGTHHLLTVKYADGNARIANIDGE